MDKLDIKAVKKFIKDASARGLAEHPAVKHAASLLREMPVTRTCRASSLRITVCTAEQAGAGSEAEELPWFSVCDTHGTCVGHKTKTDALRWAAMPTWCQECRSIINSRQDRNQRG
jgi:hypothetical protein